MNNKFITAILLAVTTTILLATQPMSAQDRITMPFSDPGRPGTLAVDLIHGSITVEGYDGTEVEIEAVGTIRQPRRPEPERAEGMRRITNRATGLVVEERDNLMTVEAEVPGRVSGVSIRVPRNTSLRLETVSGDAIRVRNVRGEIEAESNNGAIRLTDISGSAVAHALNGEIEASFAGITPGAPMSFSTLNGDIDVTLPASIHATLRMKTDNGEVFTDFELELTAGPGNVRESRRGRNQIRVDRTMEGTINGGGAEIQLTTLNGNIYIRRGN